MDKALLLAKREANTREVELPSGIGTVTVRGLTRAEVKRCKSKGDDASEDAFIAAGMVDPVLTVAEAEQWAETAPAGDTVAVMEAIRDLSGLGEGAQKSGVPGVRARRRR